LLLAHARRTVRRAVECGDVDAAIGAAPAVEPASPALAAPGAAFVTLHVAAGCVAASAP
jgi:hypothetical protein